MGLASGRNRWGEGAGGSSPCRDQVFAYVSPGVDYYRYFEGRLPALERILEERETVIAAQETKIESLETQVLAKQADRASVLTAQSTRYMSSFSFKF